MTSAYEMTGIIPCAAGGVMRVLTSWLHLIFVFPKAESALPLYFQVAKSSSEFCCENALRIPHVHGFEAGDC